MTPHHTGGRRGGNLELDRQVTQLGTTRDERRIRVSIGSKDPKKLVRANTLIDKAIENEDWDLLRAVQRGDVTIPQWIAADRQDKTKLTLAKVKLRAFLWDRRVGDDEGEIEVGAVSRAFAKVKGAKTRARYIASMTALQRKAAQSLPADAIVGDLFAVDFEQLAKQWDASPADWMHLRRALSRFATLYFGDKWDPTARELRTKIPAKRVPKRRPNLPVETFVRITEAAPAHAAAAFWVLAITGVRVGEYLRSTKAHLNAAAHIYNVPGTKTDASDAPLSIDPRWWIYLERGIPSRIRYQWLHRYWTRACVAVGLGRYEPTGETREVRKKLARGTVYTRRTGDDSRRPEAKLELETVPVLRYVGPTLHDLRHCHGQWAINAGVAESKVQGSLRHENAAQTRDYVMQAGTRDVSTALADLILGPASAPQAPAPKRTKRA